MERLHDLLRLLKEANNKHFSVTGNVLLEIQTEQLYLLAGCVSFRQWVERCPALLGYGYRKAIRVIAATKFVNALPQGVAHPQYENQVRCLLQLDDAHDVWQRILEFCTVNDRVVTAQLVEHMVAAVRNVGSAVGDDMGGGRVGGAALFSSDSDSWYTPADIVERVRLVFGGSIDLDPCSCLEANAIVSASKYYDKSQDGLAASNRWGGAVFLNPPYGMSGGASVAERFVDRALREYSTGAVSSVVMLLRAGFGCRWLQKVVGYPHCILWRRVAFVRGDSTSSRDDTANGTREMSRNPHGSIVVYLGGDVHSFVRHFSDCGMIPGATSWSYKAD
jgi:hypothetical protein